MTSPVTPATPKSPSRSNDAGSASAGKKNRRESRLAAAARAVGLKYAGRAAASRGGSGVQFVRSAALEAQRTRLPQMAAALSYRTIFGLIPILFVSLVALKMFASEEEISGALNTALQFSGLSSISVEEVAVNAAAMGPFPENVAPPTGAETEVEAPVRAHLDQWITTLVQRVDSINFRAVSIIGLVALIYAALAMLVEIERSFNQIYRVPVGRSWPRRIAQYWTLLTLGAIFLAGTFWAGQQFTKWLAETAAWGQDQQTALIAGAGYLTTVGISTALFVLAYTIVPNTRVRFLPALGGALVAACLWEASKWGFTHYVTYSAGYARLYGSIALIPLFLLWVYVTWAVVLFGLSVSYYLQHGRAANRRARAAETAEPAPTVPTIVDPGSILGVMLILAARFEKDGRPADLPQIASDLGIDRALVSQMLDRLVESGLVHQVVRDEAKGRGDARFALARPADQIDAETVLNLAEGLICPVSKTAQPISQCMRVARHEAIRGRSLAFFLQDGKQAAGMAGLPLASALASSADRHGT